MFVCVCVCVYVHTHTHTHTHIHTQVARVCKDMWGQRHGDRYMGDHVHVTYGLSKDWGMSGVRAGVLLTHNAKLTAAVSS